MYQIKMNWAKGSSMPPWAMVFDGKTGIRRVAEFSTYEDALEALWCLSMVITSSAWNGGEVWPQDIAG
jgi:hypothetical protein